MPEINRSFIRGDLFIVGQWTEPAIPYATEEDAVAIANDSAELTRTRSPA